MTHHRVFAPALIGLVLLSTMPASAALTELADGPLIDAGSVIVKPNILFTLDDSGSMQWSYMPDRVGYFSATHSTYPNWSQAVGYRNHLCNKIYFNPALTYLPGKTTAGESYGNASFTAAPVDVYGSSTTTTNLSEKFKAFTAADTDSSCGDSWGSCGNDTEQPAYYYRFKGTGTPTDAQCAVAASSNSTHSTTDWEKVQVTSDQQTNFANWYTYYRTRMLLMKTASGQAFSSLSDRYRVGFITIAKNHFLGVSDFNTDQRTAWLTALYASGDNPDGTPLPRALSRAGRYFAGKSDGINSGMTPDPVQYSCQQNFSILTTDGYWNYFTERPSAKIDGSNWVGNQDANEVRPMRDNNTVTTTTFTRTRTTYTLSRGSGSERCPSSSQRRLYTVIEEATVTNGVVGSYTQTSREYTGCSYTSTSTKPADTIVDSTPTTTATESGSSNTLSDVAAYYYNTDLRTTDLGNCTGAIPNVDVCTNNVFGPRAPSPDATNPEKDNKTTQHMTTFTLGLGISGTLTFDSNYQTQSSGDFADLRSGAKHWPIPDNASTQGDPAKSDDLWHAAVNGRGRAFAASNPFEVSQGLVTALSEINARSGAAAAAAASTLELVQGDNLIYIPRYTTAKWTGDVQAIEVDTENGTADTSKIVLSMAAKLNAQTQNACDGRNIYLYRSGATNNLVDFAWNTTRCASGTTDASTSTVLNSSEQAHFNASTIALLSQYAGMSATQKSAAEGANLVNFIRGQRGKENFTQGGATLYRTRESVMGDVIGGAPQYVRPPFFNYVDTGYAAFKTAQASRTSMLYVPGNDGMLHAFYAGKIQTGTDGSVTRNADGTPQLDANAGKEAWAFIPSTVLPNLYKLADVNYANLHQFYVDGTPTVSDIKIGSDWKTILVGGLNKGGRAYYALDVTDPLNPKALWEFKHNASNCFSGSGTHYSDCHLGYSYGNPIVTKLADGTWVVLVTSGYNNVNAPTQDGDGLGYLYVLRADDGRILQKIATSAGSASTPSGLAKITAWVDLPDENNTALRAYGGDLLGNVWRFDINDSIMSAGNEATKLAELKDASNVGQPIMTKPVLSQMGVPSEPVVFVGTGRYLGATDLSSTQTQSIYAIIDRFSSSTINPRSTLAQRTLSVGTDGYVTVNCGGVCTAPNGWYADLPTSKERVAIAPRVELGSLIVATGIPEGDACSPGGKSYIYYFDFDSGAAIPGATSNRVGFALSGGMAVGISVVKIGGKPAVNVVDNTGSPSFHEGLFASGSPTGKKVQWRELLD